MALWVDQRGSSVYTKVLLTASLFVNVGEKRHKIHNNPLCPSSASKNLLSPFSLISHSAFSLSVRTHACGLLRVICQIWEGGPGVLAKGDKREWKFLSPLLSGGLTSPALQLSPSLRTRAIQRPALDLWTFRECPRSAALAAVWGDPSPVSSLVTHRPRPQCPQ